MDYFNNQTIERAFIIGLDNVKKLNYEDLTSRLNKVIKICVNEKNLKHIIFAFYDLYFTQLILLNAPFNKKELENFKIFKKQIREVNHYAKLVEIFNENQCVEPNSKRQQTEITYNLADFNNLKLYVDKVVNLL